jgi:hypothetical protein
LLRGDRGALLIIFGTLARDFRGVPGDFGFECACVARGSASLTINGRDAVPDVSQRFHGIARSSVPRSEFDYMLRITSAKEGAARRRFWQG